MNRDDRLHPRGFLQSVADGSVRITDFFPKTNDRNTIEIGYNETLSRDRKTRSPSWPTVEILLEKKKKKRHHRAQLSQWYYKTAPRQTGIVCRADHWTRRVFKTHAHTHTHCSDGLVWNAAAGDPVWSLAAACDSDTSSSHRNASTPRTTTWWWPSGRPARALRVHAVNVTFERGRVYTKRSAIYVYFFRSLFSCIVFILFIFFSHFTTIFSIRRD